MSIIVVTCDLIHSKDLSDRFKIQENLKDAVNIVNSKYSREILCPFIIIWGDSFQGALKSLKGFYSILEMLEDNIPAKFRCGIGIGAISTKISSTTLEMDGPAFHKAKIALEMAEKNGWSIIIQSENEHFDDMVNTILILLYNIKKRWTKRQKKIIQLRKKGWTYKEIGTNVDIKPQTVHKILKAAEWKSASIAIQTLNKLIMAD
ncbi:MAG: SatD family protein [Candidatus Hodarchaeales archaeon]